MEVFFPRVSFMVVHESEPEETAKQFCAVTQRLRNGNRMDKGFLNSFNNLSKGLKYNKDFYPLL